MEDCDDLFLIGLLLGCSIIQPKHVPNNYPGNPKSLCYDPLQESSANCSFHSVSRFDLFFIAKNCVQDSKNPKPTAKEEQRASDARRAGRCAPRPKCPRGRSPLGSLLHPGLQFGAWGSGMSRAFFFFPFRV